MKAIRLLSRKFRSIALFGLIPAVIVMMTGCGSRLPSPAPPQFSGNTNLTVMLTSTGNDQLSEFDLVFNSLSLTNKGGQTFTLLAQPLGFEFLHLNSNTEPMITVSIPEGVYTGATAKIGAAQFTCMTLEPSGSLLTNTFAYGYTPDSHVSVTLPSPITIKGPSAALLVDLQVSQSASYGSCYYPNGIQPYSITPTFVVNPTEISASPSNPGNGKVVGIDGQIATVGPANTIGVSISEGDALPRSVSIKTDSNTIYQGITFAAMSPGTFLDLDSATQQDGSMLATRIAVEYPSAVNVVRGPLMYVSGVEPALTVWGREQQGTNYSNRHILGGQDFSFDSATFQVSGELTNLQALPFVPSFNGSNMVPGQNVYVSAPKLSYTSNPYTEVEAITLMPQVINGVVVSASKMGNLTDYSVSLATTIYFRT